MDQLKTFLRQLVKHRFWVISVIVSITGIVCWYMASSQLQFEFFTREQDLNKAFSDVQMVKQKQKHPNQHSQSQMQRVTTVTTNSVYEAWTTQYERQQEVLVWPKSLTEEFEIAVKHLRPIESVELDTPINKAIPATLREIYRNYINDELPKLADIVRAKWVGKAGANSRSAGLPTTGKTGEDDKSLIYWNGDNQAKIASRFEWDKQNNGIPNTVQILYAQEDLWVLEAVMNVIARTNGDVDARYKAAIKQIESIDLGADVASVGGQVTRLAEDAGMQQPGGVANPEAGRPAMPLPSAENGAAGAPGTVTIQDPAENRYVDNDLKPVPAARIRNAVRNTLTKEDGFLTAAKRMPVRMRLMVDIRKLNQLLANCGNSRLPIEVRQVRVNRQAVGGQQGGYGGLPSSPSAIPGIRPGGDSLISSGRGLADPFLVSVELYGIIYIYNPPLDALRGGAEGNRT